MQRDSGTTLQLIFASLQRFGDVRLRYEGSFLFLRRRPTLALRLGRLEALSWIRRAAREDGCPVALGWLACATSCGGDGLPYDTDASAHATLAALSSTTAPAATPAPAMSSIAPVAPAPAPASVPGSASAAVPEAAAIAGGSSERRGGALLNLEGLAASGDAEAMLVLATMLEHRVLRHARRKPGSSAATTAPASHSLAEHWLQGSRSKRAVVKDDLREAHTWYARASACGNAQAQTRLSVMLWQQWKQSRTGGKHEKHERFLQETAALGSRSIIPSASTKNKKKSAKKSKNKEGGAGTGVDGYNEEGGEEEEDEQGIRRRLKQRSLHILWRGSEGGDPAAMILLGDAMERGDVDDALLSTFTTPGIHELSPNYQLSRLGGRGSRPAQEKNSPTGAEICDFTSPHRLYERAAGTGDLRGMLRFADAVMSEKQGTDGNANCTCAEFAGRAAGEGAGGSQGPLALADDPSRLYEAVVARCLYTIDLSNVPSGGAGAVPLEERAVAATAVLVLYSSARAACEKLALFWDTQKNEGKAHRWSLASTGSPVDLPSEQGVNSSRENGENGKMNGKGRKCQRAAKTVSELSRIHEKNSGAGLEHIASHGNYLNLRKGDLASDQSLVSNLVSALDILSLSLFSLSVCLSSDVR